VTPAHDLVRSAFARRNMQALAPLDQGFAQAGIRYPLFGIVLCAVETAFRISKLGLPPGRPPRTLPARPDSAGGEAAVAGSAEIELLNVSRRFGQAVAVSDLSFSVATGEIVALLGRTGAGKSTAMNLIMGTIAPSSGSVRVAGVDPHGEFERLRGKLAVSFQTDRLLPWRTAVQNVELGLRILNVDRAETRRRASEWLGRVKMAGTDDKYAHELSGGMRQRVSLARALAVDPEILLLDESFSQLDHVTSKTLRRDVADLVRTLRKTCLLITHRIDDAIEMADRILVLAVPARVALEVRPTDADRNDPARQRDLHHQIATAMGEPESTTH
jgi:NitT/TauT family transport system ATP-binding protein